MSGLRFCMLTTFYPPFSFGGDAIGIQRFSRALVRRGHSVTVIVDTDAYNVLSPTPDPALPPVTDGVEVIPLGSDYRKLSILLTQQLGRPVMQGSRIRRLLEEGNYDVIVYNNISLVGGPGLLAYGDAVKIYMAHEHWLVCPSHVLWRHGKELCNGRECLRCVLHYRRPPQLWRYTGLLNRQQRHIDTFIAMSEFSRDKHREFGFPRDMEVVNYFLPDIDSTTPAADDDSPHDRPYFLFVGRLEKIKGLDDVIPVFRDYEGADLLIAGDGEYTDELKAIAGDNPHVKFLGRIAPEELDRLYRHAIALIVPSVCFETFGIILIESFRQGTPVLARRIGPFPEIVSRSQGGLLFEGPDDLVGAMQQMQSDPEFRDRMAAQARAGFLKNWSEDAVIPRLLEVVQNTAVAKNRMDIANKLEASS
ncbi:MAG: glycosyltransferase family 4 protein [Gammaproteobacteria bacterium]|nr:glycosyltransferase family 4 protein [Gammaproteobacteria bacterium]